MAKISDIDVLGLKYAEAETMEKHDENPLDGIWIFVVGDLFIFASYFITYALWRNWGGGEFLASQQYLSVEFGFFNTLVLLTSSWFVAGAMRAQRAGDYDAAARLAVMTMICGMIFVISKVTEWVVAIQAGFTFTYDMFSQFYFWMTGVHILHVIFGMMALGRLWMEMRDPAARNPNTAEACGVFWHLVDLLWLVIFPLLYLMR